MTRAASAAAPLLSVLVCGIPSRLEKKFPAVMRELDWQAEGQPVEVLALVDNCSMTTGEKRNLLVKIARGRYFSFVDDDDRVAPCYVEAILGAIRSSSGHADVIVFDVWVSGYLESHDLHDRRCRYDVDYSNEDLPELYKRKPNHLMVWRAEIAKSVPFPDLTSGEDVRWAERVSARYGGGFVLKQHRIDEVLYYYDFDPRSTATQVRKQGVRGGEERSGDRSVP